MDCRAQNRMGYSNNSSSSGSEQMEGPEVFAFAAKPAPGCCGTILDTMPVLLLLPPVCVCVCAASSRSVSTMMQSCCTTPGSQSSVVSYARRRREQQLQRADHAVLFAARRCVCTGAKASSELSWDQGLGS